MSALDPTRTFTPYRLGNGTGSHRDYLGSMPRFYFPLHDDGYVPDDEGVELPNLDAARAHAVRCATLTFGELAKDEGRVVLHHRIDIEDERHIVLETVFFRDAVSVEE